MLRVMSFLLLWTNFTGLSRVQCFVVAQTAHHPIAALYPKGCKGCKGDIKGDIQTRLVTVGHYRNGAPIYASATATFDTTPSSSSAGTAGTGTGTAGTGTSIAATVAAHTQNIRNEFIWKNKGELILLMFVAMIATLSSVTVPLFFSKVLTALTATPFDLQALLKPLSMMLLCHTVEPCMTILYIRKCSYLIDRFISTLRMSLYSNILRRDVSSFELNSPLSSTQLVIGEIDKIKTAAMANISRDRGFRAMLELMSGLGILYTLCLPLAMFFSTIIPLTAYVSSRFASGLSSAAMREGEASSKQANRAQETISNFKEVFSFSNQPLEEKKFSEVQQISSTAAINTGHAKANFEAANRAGIYTNILSLFAVGGIFITKKIVEPVVLVSFIGYCFSLNFATQGLLFSLGDIKTAQASWEKIQKFLTEPSVASIVSEEHSLDSSSSATSSDMSMDSRNSSSSISSSRSSSGSSSSSSGSNSINEKGSNLGSDSKNRNEGGRDVSMDISLRDVSFSYSNRPDLVVLHNVNLLIPKGKVTALVGPSGAGKSTIAALLNRFYEPTSGELIVNGVKSGELSRDDYLRHVSVVRQSPSLFTDTVANNIAYGAIAYRDVSRAEVIESAKAANAHSFIISLPEGYDTVLGEGAGFVQLSGGQKQRVAIARALLKNAPLLVLDEATSALDSESEALVQDALDQLIKGRTTVVIAHRLSTVIGADQIVVVKGGTIAETGKHEELMSKKGFYYNLMSTQMSAYEVQKQ